jgi:uncharacterized membrane protein
MKLNAPTKLAFLIAVILFILALLAEFVVPARAVVMPWLWIAAFVVLALGVLLKNF